MTVNQATEAQVVRLESNAIAEAKAILCRAYKNEPAFQYIFDKNHPGYDQRVRATIRELIEQHFSNKQSVIGIALKGQLVAVALLGGTGDRMGLVSRLNWRMRMLLTTGFECTARYIDYHTQIQACLTAGQYHELPLLGVDIKFRHRGYGKQLINAIEQICKESPRSVGIALATVNAQYLDYYHHLGYKMVGQVQLGDCIENVLLKSCLTNSVKP
jgi:GNAT superfamily N-acetyltransferase